LNQSKLTNSTPHNRSAISNSNIGNQAAVGQNTSTASCFNGNNAYNQRGGANDLSRNLNKSIGAGEITTHNRFSNVSDNIVK
jgi:hypothetical protein